MAVGAAAGAAVQGVAAAYSPGANAGQVADDVASSSKQAARKLADNMKPNGHSRLSCSVAPFFHFLLDAPLKMVFPKQGSLFFQGH